jgi:glucosylceramidase
MDIIINLTKNLTDMRKQGIHLIMLVAFSVLTGALSAQSGTNNRIESWVTNQDRSSLFTKQPGEVNFSDRKTGWGATIVIDDSQQYQTIDGFGFALTGGSAEHLMKMNPQERSKILKEIFSDEDNCIGVTYLRVSIGSSDLNSFVFSYDDLKAGETDFDLKKFSLGLDLKDVVPVLKEILAINPTIKILGSPWSAPAWMKTNNNVRGGKLKEDCYDVYARYFVKYIQEMKKLGIVIDAVTIQNEPLNSKNTPSMTWFACEEANFVRNNIGPAFKDAGITTKIIVFDHNCDRPDFPLAILNYPDAAKYVDGSGFHFYAGNMTAMSHVHLARPDKNIYFTEQMVTEEPGSKEINIVDPVKELILGSTRNWSKNVILWNLAADSLNDPHTDNGGCTMCQGAVTIDGNTVKRNIAYYTIAHASKFVRPGSVRIASTNPGDKTIQLYEDEQRSNDYRLGVIDNTQVLPNVAFRTSDGKIVLIAVNDSRDSESINIQYEGKFATIKLKPGSAGTFIWSEHLK